jgi:hypothetical protein
MPGRRGGERVIRQICPHCFKSVELPDQSAGADSDCPACGKSFTVPKPYTPSVDPGAIRPTSVPLPPPPPVSVPVPPPVDPNRPAPPPGYAPPPGTVGVTSSQYSSATAVNLSSGAVGWIPVVGFTLILVLTLFPWVGCYPGGISAYTQSFWGALGNGLSADTTAEQVMKQERALSEALRSDWWLLLPYLLAVLLGVALAWADRLVTSEDFAYRVGPFGTLRAMVWPRRGAILYALAAVSAVFFTLESLRGFGLEAAVRTVSAMKHKEEAEKVDNTADRQKVLAKIGVEKASFGVGSGYAYWLVAAAHLIVLTAATARIWLDSRGENAPPPRLVAEW